MCFVRDASTRAKYKWDADHTWTVYISHDPCHDGGYPKVVDDRNTLIAFHRENGTFKIIGRELPRALALEIAGGEK